MSEQDRTKCLSGLVFLGGLGLSSAAASAGQVTFDASTSALQVTAYSVVAAGSPLETKDEQTGFDFVFGNQGQLGADITAQASGAGYAGQAYTAGTGEVGSNFDGEGLGALHFGATHTLGFVGAGAVSEGTLSSFVYFGSFAVDGLYRLQGELSSVNTTFAQLLIFDAANSLNVFAQIDGVGDFDVMLGSGNYVIQYISEYAVGTGTTPTAYAQSSGYITVATAVPLPSGVMGGGVLLGGLALHRKYRRR